MPTLAGTQLEGITDALGSLSWVDSRELARIVGWVTEPRDLLMSET